jgi:hypothetical protein
LSSIKIVEETAFDEWWMTFVLRRIADRNFLTEATAALVEVLSLAQDIVMEILPFLELPSYTIELEEEEDDDGKDTLDKKDSGISLT